MSSENPHRFATLLRFLHSLLRWNSFDCLFSLLKYFMEIEDEKKDKHDDVYVCMRLDPVECFWTD